MLSIFIYLYVRIANNENYQYTTQPFYFKNHV